MKTALKTTALLSLLALAGCFRNDIRTEVYSISDLRTEQDASIIAQALQPVPGIKEIRPDFENHTLTVIFNGLDAYPKNIEYAIVKAGYGLPNCPASETDKAKRMEMFHR